MKALALIVVLAASPAVAGDWFFSEKVDEMTDEKYSGLVRQSDSGKESMVITCSGRSAQVAIAFKRFLTLEKDLRVQQRLGTKPADDVLWSASENTLSHPSKEGDAVRFIREMAAQDKFLIRAAGETASFTIGDLAENLPKLSGCF